MVSITEKILHSEQILSIEDIGGEEYIWNEQNKFSTSKVYPEVLEIFLNEYSSIKDLDSFKNFILNGLTHNESFEAIEDALNLIVVEDDKLNSLFSDIGDILINKIKKRSSNQEAYTAAVSLDSAIQLSLKKHINKHRILAELTDVNQNENPIFAQKAIRLIGVCFEHWKELDLIESLKCFLSIDEVNGDAYYELGMTNLHQSFESSNEEVMICHLQKAKEYFLEAINNDEERLDAEVYNKVVDIVLNLKDKSSFELLSDYINELEQLIDIRHKWLFKTDKNWLTPRYTSEIEWLKLSIELKDTINNIKKNGTADHWVLLKKIINVYKSSRSIVLRGSVLNLSQIIEPELCSQLIDHQSTKEGLIAWLKSDFVSVEYKEEATSLLGKIATFQKKSPSEWTTFNNPLLNPYELLGLQEGELPDKEKSLLNQYNEILGINGFSNIVIDEIYKQIIEQLKNTQYFTGAVRINFSLLFGHLLKFLESRTNIENRGRYKYLYDKNALENELADDIKDFLDGSILYSNKVTSELRDVAGGRVDLHINFQGYNFVAELKRESSDISKENIRKQYLAQAGTYQATGLNLGFLVVLDLTSKKQGLANIQSNVWLDVIPPQREGDLEKNIVVICIPGNKVSPSKTKL